MATITDKGQGDEVVYGDAIRLDTVVLIDQDRIVYGAYTVEEAPPEIAYKYNNVRFSSTRRFYGSYSRNLLFRLWMAIKRRMV